MIEAKRKKPEYSKPVVIVFLSVVLYFFTACSEDSAPSQKTNAARNKTQLTQAVAEPEQLENKTVKKPAKQKPPQNQLGLSKPYDGKLASLAALNIRNARLEKLTDKLVNPWALEFINESEIIITEIAAKISHFNLKTNTLTAISGLPEITSNNRQIGLLDIEIHPDFEDNGLIYFSYSKSDPESNKYYSLAVSRAILKQNKLSHLKTIFDANPYTWSPANFGGALEFDDKGYLFVATGDRSESESAQSLDSMQGKILRLNDDGTAAADNPFIHDSDIDNRIYAIGVRNPQGLHYDNKNKTLYEAEHGPMGGDEVNIITAGTNYGWPIITHGMSYMGTPISQNTHQSGLAQPLFYYLPSEAISPLTLYRGEMFHEWDGDLLVGVLKGKHISKLDLNQGTIRSEYPILNEIKGRIRDIKVASDGAIFILAQTGVLYRLYRDTTVQDSSAEPPDGKTTYELVCAGCHDTGAYQAPILGKKEHWKKIIEQPLELTYKHTIEGYKAMPVRGLCNICKDNHLKITVDYMLQQSGDDGEVKTIKK